MLGVAAATPALLVPLAPRCSQLDPSRCSSNVSGSQSTQSGPSRTDYYRCSPGCAIAGVAAKLYRAFTVSASRLVGVRTLRSRSCRVRMRRRRRRGRDCAAQRGSTRHVTAWRQRRPSLRRASHHHDDPARREPGLTGCGAQSGSAAERRQSRFAVEEVAICSTAPAIESAAPRPSCSRSRLPRQGRRAFFFFFCFFPSPGTGLGDARRARAG